MKHSIYRCMVLVFAAALAPLSLAVQPTVFKCNLDGVVSYQSDPCPIGAVRPPPTVEQLNAERIKRQRQANKATATAAASAPFGQGDPLSAPIQSSKCDGRIHCSQMSSCTEAKYFLRHCPGVKMDGDGDGIPCEQQWCNG